MKRGQILRLAAFVALVAGLFVLARAFPVAETIVRFLDSVRSLGLWGPVALAGAYVAATVAMVPGLVLTLGAGFAFGLLVGTVTVSLASTLGATAAFLVGRTLARDWVAQLAARNPRFHAVDRAAQEHGFKIVLLIRLSPLFPFNLLNYLFALTSVRLRDYVLASWIGMLPGTVMYVYFGTALKSLAEVASGRVEGGMLQRVMFLLGLGVTVAVTVYVTRLARRAIRQYVDESPARENPSAPSVTQA